MLSQTIDQKMREVIRYFADNNFDVSEIIIRGRKQGLNEKRVLSGMMRVYEKIQQGEVIKPRNLVWKAWEEARGIKNSDVMNFLLNRDKLIAENKKLRKNVAIVYVACLLSLCGSWLFFFLFVEYWLGAKLWG